MNEFFINFAYVAIGMFAGWVFRPFYEGFAKRRGELLAERGYAAELELERARGRQGIDQQNEAHKAQLASRNQMQSACMEIRLRAHQEAFTLWRKLYSEQNSKDIGAVIIECQDWWNRNCLFLDADARDKFSRAYLAVGGRNTVREIVDKTKLMELFDLDQDILDDAGRAIVQAVSLPPITADSKFAHAQKEHQN